MFKIYILHREDGWSWSLSPDGSYSVKFAYSSLIKDSSAISSPHGDIMRAIARVWKSWAPFKVVVFSWQLILDKIPTRCNLQRCGVPLSVRDLGCVFSGVVSGDYVVGVGFCEPPGSCAAFPCFHGLRGVKELD